jgi:hypothetical protein
VEGPFDERSFLPVSSTGRCNTLVFWKDGVLSMKYRQRTFYTDKPTSEMWGRWQRGLSTRSIGRRFDRASSSIFPHLAITGGIRPPDRARSRFALMLIERAEISHGLAANRSFRSIGRTLRRAPSTVSREGHRNGGRQAYRARDSTDVRSLAIWTSCAWVIRLLITLFRPF